MKQYMALFLVGISLFSMFFGGGNLVFPIWVGMSSTSPILSIAGFILSSVLLPFYGVLIGIYFKGDYEKCLGVWGKPIAHVIIFSLLLFWIPLGSGPRCNQLGYGAFCELGLHGPLWAYSLAYSLLVYFLTLKRGFFLEILGKVVTPLLIFFLFFLIFSVFRQTTDKSFIGEMAIQNFYFSLVKGYNTMDFIAAIFFSSTIICLLKEKQRDKFRFSFVRNACLIAISLLTIVYLGMFAIGWMKADVLESISGARFLASVGNHMFGGQFQIIIFMIITLSVLSTSMALALVYTDYLHKTVFRSKIDSKYCLMISVGISFVLSMIGFEALSVFISYAMSVLYPVLLVTTTVACVKKYCAKQDPHVLNSDL